MENRTAFAYLPLWRTAWRRARQRPFQYILLILGIALGVAMIVAIDLSNGSAQRALDISADAVMGKATHRVVGGRDGSLDQQVYLDIRKQGYDFSAPVIEGYVLAPKMGNRVMRLMGVDPFAEPPFRPDIWRQQDLQAASNFLIRPNGVILSRDVATEYHLAPGDNFTLQVEGTPTTVSLVGLITPVDAITGQRLRDLVLADIATAQELFHMPDKLSHIDMIIKDQATAMQIKKRLPSSVRLEPAAAQNNAMKQMMTGFTVNLTAMSLIALLVGTFLIYNTVTFNVVQRRRLFGMLRCLGVTRDQLFWLVMTETLVAALLGSGLGLLFGVWLGESLIGLVTQSINDLYFVVNVREVALSTESLLKGLVIGIIAALLAALPPAVEAMRSTPANTLRRSALEGKVTTLVPWLWAAGFGLGGFGALMLWWPGKNLVLAFIGFCAVLTAFALIAAPVSRLVMLRVAPLLGRLFGPLGWMAPRDIVRSLSRTSVAIGALMTAVSVIVGVSLMVGSFRQTFASWLGLTLQTDIYVSAPSLVSTRPSGNLPADAVRILSEWPGVREAVTSRFAAVFAPDWGREVDLTAVSGDISDGKRPYRWIGGDERTLWQRFSAGEGVMISEPLVSRQNLRTPPEPITLMTDSGPRTFPVLAIYSDYTSDQGVVLMDQATYRSRWHDVDVTTMALFLKPGVSVDGLLNQLHATFAGRKDIVIQSSRSLREAALATFDRSFAVTRALQLVATTVAFIGVLGALLSLALERAHELGVFRAIGMSRRQLWRLVCLAAGLMGGMAGLIALPAGFVLAWILIHIINVRSFGWTLEMQFEFKYFGQAFLVAVVAALAAGVYPAWRSARLSIASAIREE
ncbi:FtsX-like permease family protein [Mycobacterium haemophilum]|uniref:ABC transporter substrate-binding protein n=1 Tax=Mycobacterium haemophilum TaxID=29311 RepID=A0A0I9VJ51_9MYCO|nr:ABC transporter permease [Mycobacterium haemophilum]KLO32469.1 ABC transporter substrate-binding protein [Mycobacterium haemophilum]KLO38607.1 ABC transporter substrate-binding protein [Mycobacterium haemophilum]KLO45048.1 ABC transporter substrate-binding protein [Mycobacterium haemophilum]KLO56285.1 ABC transporter substrate-binding protein [Mycobacterium haemophilum]